jgi:hypothetical protein
VTESITPRVYRAPQIRFQPSLLSIPSAASSVVPQQKAPAIPQRRPGHTGWRKLWLFTALSALLGTATAGALVRSRSVSPHIHSGTPSFKKSSGGQQLLWSKPQVTVYLDESLAKLGPQANEAVIQAFGQWVSADAKLPQLRFDTGQTSPHPKQDGKNTVSYAPITAAGHERDVAITITYANDASGEILEADVVLNSHYPMGVLTPKQTSDAAHGKSDHEEADGCESRYDTQNVVTHEAGHFFGLGEDTTERGATMFFSIDQCEIHKRVLSTTDVGAVVQLYASSQAQQDSGGSGSAGCSIGQSPAAPASGQAALLATAVTLGLGLARRRRAR